jgi:peptide/nickel transport system ATP-binding protein
VPLEGAEKDSENLLVVKNLKKYFPIKSSFFKMTVGNVKAVDGVSFAIKRGTTMGLVGESGCGKSTTGRTILRLQDKTEGEVFFDGRDIFKLSKEELRKLRPRIQIIFQDPYSSLSPRLPIGEIIAEAVREHGIVPAAELDDYVTRVMEACGLQEWHKNRYPHEFSGGQRQRICIARAIALKPKLLICDEAVSALDLSIRAQVLDLLGGLKDKLGLSFMFITHDVGVVQHVADHIIVMHRGRIVEEGTADEVLKNPKEAYTRRLMASVPKIGRPLADIEDVVE